MHREPDITEEERKRIIELAPAVFEKFNLTSGRKWSANEVAGHFGLTYAELSTILPADFKAGDYWKTGEGKGLTKRPNTGVQKDIVITVEEAEAIREAAIPMLLNKDEGLRRWRSVSEVANHFGMSIGQLKQVVGKQIMGERDANKRETVKIIGFMEPDDREETIKTMMENIKTDMDALSTYVKTLDKGTPQWTYCNSELRNLRNEYLNLTGTSNMIAAHGEKLKTMARISAKDEHEKTKISNDMKDATPKINKHAEIFEV